MVRGARRPEAAVESGAGWRGWAALLCVAVGVVYLPALHGDYLWDDDDYVVQNRTLDDLDGLRRIWFDFGATPQYYPLVHTTFWIERRLGGLDPFLHHVTNVALHAASSVLLAGVLRRLQVPGAWLAAFLFALHPVHVESVAWITERKNVLSALFYLLAAGRYLQYALPGEAGEAGEASSSGRWWRSRDWWWAALFFVGALLSKTVTFSLPAALAVVLWWKRGRWEWRELGSLAPLVLLAVGPVFTTIWLERTQVGATGEDWQSTGVEKLLVAGRILWFYPAKLVWPVQLAFIYPRWEIDASQAWQYLYPAAALAVLVGAWAARRRIGRAAAAGLFIYAGTLVPALGFFNVYPMRYSYVADHFVYLASLGLIVPAAAGLATAASRIGSAGGRRAAWALVLSIPPALGVVAWRQCHIYVDLPTLWLDTLAKNPACWMARTNLGAYYAGRLDFEAAEREYLEAIRWNAKNAEAFLGLGAARSNRGRFDDAEAPFQEALRLDPQSPVAHFTYGMHRGRRGDMAGAAELLKRAVELNSEFADAHYFLGEAFWSSGRAAEAAACFERAVELNPRHVRARHRLGRQALEAGEWEAAIRHLQAARAADPADEAVRQDLERARRRRL